MDDLTYTLRALCQRNRDGSHATQADRLRTLALMSHQLREGGFRQMRCGVLSERQFFPPSGEPIAEAPHELRRWEVPRRRGCGCR